jgi:beta-glucosidase
MKKQKVKGKGLWMALSIVFTILFVFMMIAGPIANSYEAIINMVLHTESFKTIGDEKVEDIFTADYPDSASQAEAAQELCKQLEASGAVLLKNDGALPLGQNARVSLLGQGSVDMIYSGGGSGNMDTSKMKFLKDALEQDGYEVNPTLWKFYTEGAGKDYRRQNAPGSLNNYIFDNAQFFINEVPMDVYSDAEWNSVGEYGDAAIVVLGRKAGEGSDLPVIGAGEDDGNLLSLTTEERALLAKAAELKTAGTVKDIVVLLNTSNAIELDFLNPAICGEDYAIDACLWIGEVGQTGIEAIGGLLNGTYNPSGKLVDTWCYDNTTSPAIQNAYVTSYTNAAEKNLAFKDKCNEYYAVYEEGIYVGYRYYETRYEDAVLGQGNAGGYDYSTTVAFPFGYGLSYTTFDYSDFSMTENADSFTFTVDVTNTGNVDGREVVEIFMQSPYTDYDRENRVEKASVELVGFDKQTVKAGETVTFSIDVPKQELRAYDSEGAGTYIVDAGDYYFSVGNGAHEALNNILATKGAQVEGRSDLTAKYTVETLDTATYAKAVTGAEIVNQLDHADLNKADSDTSNDIIYVSRSDWEGTMPASAIADGKYRAAVQMAASDEIVKGLSGPVLFEGSTVMPEFGREGQLNLAQFINVPLDGTAEIGGQNYTWDDLVSQISFSQMAKLIGQAYHSTVPLSQAGKPATKDENGPQGITATLTGGGSSTSYTSADIRASAFDVELSEAVGRSLGNDCLLASGKTYSGLYGPGVNIHRTPYSGRNFEYYSEDPFVSGKICAAETRGIQSKGVYVYLKHFAMNDQETGRDGICIWTNEQAARELYLQAFEYPIVEGNAWCVMTSFNRNGTVWAGGDHNLLTNIMRGEWGMQGFAVTDYSNSNSYMDVIQGLLAGGDAWDCNDATKWTDKLKEYADDPAVASAAYDATKRILYTVAHSNAMNGVNPNIQIVEVTPWWKTAILVCDIVFGLLAAGSVFMLVKTIRKAGKEEK